MIILGTIFFFPHSFLWQYWVTITLLTADLSSNSYEMQCNVLCLEPQVKADMFLLLPVVTCACFCFVVIRKPANWYEERYLSN